MTGPVTGRASLDGQTPGESGSPKGKRLSGKFANIFHLRDRIDSAPLAANSAPPTLERRAKQFASPPPSNSLPSSPPLPRSLLDTPPKGNEMQWFQAIQKLPSSSIKEGSPGEQIERQFHALLKILSDRDICEHAVVHTHLFPHIRFNKANTQTDKDLFDAVEVIFACMETAIAEKIFYIDGDEIIKLGMLLFKNPFSKEILKKDPKIQHRWFLIHVDFKIHGKVEQCSNSLELLKTILPSVKLICIGLMIKQNKTIEEIKKILNDSDVKKRTLKSNPDWMNEKIIERLDLKDAYAHSSISYFQFMHHVNELFWKPDHILAYRTFGLEPLSFFFTEMYRDLEIYFDLIYRAKHKDIEEFLASVERGFHTREKIDVARFNFERHDYPKVLNCLNENFTRLFQRLDEFNSVLSQLIRKGNGLMDPLERQKLIGEGNNAKLLLRIAHAAYPKVLEHVKARLETLNDAEEMKKEFHQLKRSSEKQLDALSRLYHAVEAKIQAIAFTG